MLKYSFNMQEESENMENAVKKALSQGYRTSDIAKNEEETISTSSMGEIIADFI